MLNYQSSIKENKSYSGLNIKEISPIMKLNLRGKSREFLSTIGKNINMILPLEANTSSSSDKYTSIWLSPDEWMVISNNSIDKENNNYEIEELLFNKISKNNLGAVIDVSDQFILINLEGEKVFDLLSTGCPFDFTNFKTKKGAVVQTLLTQVDIIIHHKEQNNINLLVRRSFSEHLMSWIEDAASRL
ncbi:sarcosine oxidase subunit gamma [Candidatus Pelagibacter bacterium]|nr:sarcosine oxidase subunit gamma [Candidatus Pelagibacter bacterium]|tara:strand:+ start:248 stop:811 length:564 start_codon:yes stop_codon:yes gene_type:complete